MTPDSLDLPPDPDLGAAPTGLATLNATSFFLAEVVGVAVPLVSDLLRDWDWSQTAVGADPAPPGSGRPPPTTPAG